MWGGLVAGLGLGSCLALSLHIFEIANPQADEYGSRYPSMGTTVLWVLVFSSAFGLGLGLLACALIRNENALPAGAASVTDPADAGSSQAAQKPERRILGLRIDS